MLRYIFIALLALQSVRGFAQPTPSSPQDEPSQPASELAAEPAPTTPSSPSEAETNQTVVATPPEANEPPVEFVDRSGALTASPERARGWAERPESPGHGPVQWLGRGLGTLVYPVALITLLPAKGALYLESHYSTFSNIKAFFYNDAETAGVLPTGAFLSGTGLMFGAKAFHSDLFGNEEEIALSAVYGFAVGREVQLKFELPHLMNNRFFLQGRSRYEDRNNLLFAGLGNSTVMTGTDLAPRDASIQTRYAETRWLGLLAGGVELHPGGSSLRLGGAAIFNQRTFDDSVDSSLGTSLGDIYDATQLVGFDSGFSLLELTADVAFDTRPNDGPDNSGFAAEAFVGGPVTSDYSYVHYGVEAHGYLQPWRPRRLIALRIAHEAVRGDSELIPFTELPRLGGAGLLRGYARDTFRDKQATIATIEYHYPVHENLSGQFFIESGKVTKSYADLSAGSVLEHWNFGYGGGLLVHTRSGIKVRADIAWGDALRFYLSTDVLEAFQRRGREL